jgi:hypothetical protein
MTITATSSTLSDLAHLAPNMVSAAIAVTAGKMHLDSPEAAAEYLEQNHPVAVMYFRHELARQIAALLLQMCGTIDAVYEEHDVPESDEMAPATVSLTQPLRLYILVSLETAAAHSLIEGLSDALRAAFSFQVKRVPKQVIDHIVVDDRGSHLLGARAMGYRPAPLLLASRAAMAARSN